MLDRQIKELFASLSSFHLHIINTRQGTPIKFSELEKKPQPHILEGQKQKQKIRKRKEKWGASKQRFHSCFNIKPVYITNVTNMCHSFSTEMGDKVKRPSIQTDRSAFQRAQLEHNLQMAF